MTWLTDWWNNEVVHGHKGPLLLSLAAFVVTFAVTRGITRMIRAGRGPFRNVSTGGVHLHHSTPGLILLIVGAFTAVGATEESVWNYLAAALVGIGASLVLDEFAMIFRLQDVYWSKDGQLSVNMVTLAAACVGLAVAGLSPVNVTGLSSGVETTRTTLAVVMTVNLIFVVITALKGKYATALVGIFFYPIVWYAAVRLARPRSPWYRWFYNTHERRRALARDRRFDARWGSVRRRWDDFIGGSPTPAATAPDDAR